MIKTKREEVLERVCYHRGVGRENTLESIESAIKISPFMSEFDVQWRQNTLRLGHPPEHHKETLEDALKLFSSTKILPKIDLKLTDKTFDLALDELIKQLEILEPRKAIVNISGTLLADDYMRAETKFMEQSGSNALLNIDIDRYGVRSDDEIIAHLNQLKRAPFSISPDLGLDLEQSIDIAKATEIKNIHFWTWYYQEHTIDFLHETMERCQNNGLTVYFDIKESNILHLEPILDADEVTV